MDVTRVRLVKPFQCLSSPSSDDWPESMAMVCCECPAGMMPISGMSSVSFNVIAILTSACWAKVCCNDSNSEVTF